MTNPLESAIQRSMAQRKREALRKRIIVSILQERARQPQGQDHDPHRWLTIIGKLYGDLCEAILRKDPSFDTTKVDFRFPVNDTIQLAATLVAFLEHQADSWTSTIWNEDTSQPS